jgi:hypothetical protein
LLLKDSKLVVSLSFRYRKNETRFCDSKNKIIPVLRWVNGEEVKAEMWEKESKEYTYGCDFWL